MIIDEPKKKSNAPLIILMFLIGIGLGFGANYGLSYLNKDVDKKESSSVSEDKSEEKTTEVSADVKEKLGLFIEAASSSYSGRGSFMKSFVDGKTTFDSNDKYTLVYSVMYLKNLVTKDVIISPEEIKSIKDEKLVNYFKTYADSQHDIMKASIFDYFYNYLFNETGEKKYADNVSVECPGQVGFNEETNNIYLGQECGGTGGFSYDQKIDSYEFDGENYLVHQSGTFIPNPGDKENIKLLWKFDKDLNFVSTEKE